MLPTWVAKALASWSPGALKDKVDVEEDYWLIPVHPGDYHLLAVQWKEDIFAIVHFHFNFRRPLKYFTLLPMHWSGMPGKKEPHMSLEHYLGDYINAVADAFEWSARQQAVSLVEHYLDDYIILGPPASDHCQSTFKF